MKNAPDGALPSGAERSAVPPGFGEYPRTLPEGAPSVPVNGGKPSRTTRPCLWRAPLGGDLPPPHAQGLSPTVLSL